MAELSAKMQMFADRYLSNGFNATEAAEHAQYAHPNKQGPRLLVNVGIAEYIKARIAAAAMPADEVLARLADQARATFYDFFTVSEHRHTDDTGEEHITHTRRLDLNRIAAAGKLHLIKSYSLTRTGERIELYDAQAALALLGKHHGLFVDKVEQSGGLTIKVQYADSDADPSEAP